MSAIKVSPLSKQHNFVLPQDKVYSFTFPKGGKMANEDRVSTIITTTVDSTFIITALGYTPEDSENRIDDITGHTADSTTYLSSKGVYDFINAGVVTDSVRVATSITASYATASTIAIFDASKNLVTASTGTYPSLTELSYVKGVTSAVQTQINAKQASHANLTSLSALTYTSRAFVVMNAAGSFSLDANTYLTSNQTITLSGDISGSGSTAISTTIGANKVTNAMLAQVSTATFHGRVTAGTGNVENLTGTQATTLLDTFTSSLKGLAPASGGGTTNFLRADGNWAAPSGGGTPGGSTTQIQYNNAGSFAGSANFVWDNTNVRVGIAQSSPTSRFHLNFNQNSETQADANGILLANSTPAILGTQSISPAIVWQGNGWKTTATAASQETRWRADVLPIQGTSAPTSQWQLSYSINGAAYTNVLTVNSNATGVGVIVTGKLVVNTGDLQKGNFVAGGNNAYQSSQILVGLADTSLQSYRTTSGGSSIATKLLCIYNGSNSASGTLGIVADAVNGLMFTAANGSNMIARAAITIGNLTNTAGSEAGDLLFHTQNSGAAYTQKMRISKAGNIVLGNEAALSTSATDGFNYVPSCAGTPTGTPTSYTGMIPHLVDTSGTKVWYYIGGAWKYALLV